MRTLRPPSSIDFDFFALVWDRIEGTYILALPDGRSFELGDTQQTFIYFRNVLNMEQLGERAMDSARNWYTAIVIPADNRCFGAETEESGSEYKRLFKHVEDEVLVV
jgi:hypothetical protein